jgi:hypothetical protein
MGVLPWLSAFAIGCLGLLAAGAHSHHAGHCAAPACPMAMPAAQPGQAVAAAAYEWLLMIGAMMPPQLTLPVSHVMASTFRRDRAPALLLFAAGYFAPWIAAGLVLVPVEQAAVAQLGGAAFPIAAAAAFCWTASPAARRARERRDRLRAIRALGLAGLRDCFMQGATSGRPCVLACGPWMILPMVAPIDHWLATAIATMLVILGRCWPALRPRWQWPRASSILAVIGRLRSLAPQRPGAEPGQAAGARFDG